jgi:outer membrane usher protein
LIGASVNFQGLTGERGESVRLSSEYRSRDFHTPGEINTLTTGVIYPEWNYWLNLNATYSAPVGSQTTASLSGRYEFVNDEQFGDFVYAQASNRYGVDVTLSRPFTQSVTGSLTLGYSNESYLLTVNPVEEADPQFRVGVRLFIRPDEHTSVTAGYDTLDQQSYASAYRSEGDGIGRWDTSVDVQQNEFVDHASVSATAGYYGNRAQVRVIHNSGFDGISYGDFNVKLGPQRTSLQVGTAIAFADGHVAIGAPVSAMHSQSSIRMTA